MEEYKVLVWDYTNNRERLLVMRAPFEVFCPPKNEKGHYILRQESNGEFIEVEVIREAAPEDISGNAVKKMIQHCLLDQCFDCMFVNESRENCRKQLLRNALDYIIRLEENDRRRTN